MNTLRIPFILLCFLLNPLLGFSQSTQAKELVLESKYDQIKNIISIANCTGPGGSYTTEVHATNTGYTYFHQQFSYRPNDFKAILTSPDCGYYYEGEDLKYLSFINRQFIRSHEFHKISIAPFEYFNEVKLQGDAFINNQKCKMFSGVDHSGNSVKLFYSPKEQLILGFEMKNFIDTTEVIQVIHKNWTDTDYGKMIKALEIIQGGRDTFHFNFDQILINTDLATADSETCEKIAEEGLLMEAVNKFNKAFAEGDVAIISSMITEEYLHTNGISKSIGKESWLNYFRKRKQDIDAGKLKVNHYEMDEVEVAIYGESAIVTAKVLVSMEKEGVVTDNEYRVTHLWVKENGIWKRAGFHDGIIK